MFEQSLDYYRNLVSAGTCKIELSADEKAVILKSFDNGIRLLSTEEVVILDAVISKLKDVIHP